MWSVTICFFFFFKPLILFCLSVVDHGCVGVQRSGYLLWHEDPGLVVNEALSVAGPVEHSYIQVRLNTENSYLSIAGFGLFKNVMRTHYQNTVQQILLIILIYWFNI